MIGAIDLSQTAVVLTGCIDGLSDTHDWVEYVQNNPTDQDNNDILEAVLQRLDAIRNVLSELQRKE